MEHERWGTPVPSYVAGFAPDARPLDRGKPRDQVMRPWLSGDLNIVKLLTNPNLKGHGTILATNFLLGWCIET